MRTPAIDDIEAVLVQDRPRPDIDKLIENCRVAIANGDLEQAHLLAVQIVISDWTAPDGYIFFCEIFGRSGLMQAAIATGEKAVEVAPQDERAYLHLAEALHCAGDSRRACAVLSEGGRSCPATVSIYWQLAHLAATTNRSHLAGQAYRELLLSNGITRHTAVAALDALTDIDGEEAARLAPKLADRFTGCRMLRNMAAESFLIHRDPGRALACIEAGGVSDSDFAVDSAVLAVYVRAQIDLGRIKKARSAFRRFQSVSFQTDPQLMALKALLNRLDGRVDAALQDYQAALRQRPGDPLLLMGQARLLEAKGYDNESLRLYREVSNQVPNDPEAYVNIARVLDRLGRTGESAEAAERARDLFGHPLTLIEVAAERSRETAALLAPEDWARILDNGLLTDGEHIAALHTFAEALMVTGRHDSARQVLAEANARQRHRLRFALPAFRTWFSKFLIHQQKVHTGLSRDFVTDFRIRPVILAGMPGPALDSLAAALNAEFGACTAYSKALQALFEAAVEAETYTDMADLDHHVLSLRQQIDEIGAVRGDSGFFVVNAGLMGLATALLQRLFPDALFIFLEQEAHAAVQALYMHWRPASDPWGNDPYECLGVMSKVAEALPRAVSTVAPEQRLCLSAYATDNNLENCRNAIDRHIRDGGKTIADNKRLAASAS